jgi:hypothetical protein
MEFKFQLIFKYENVAFLSHHIGKAKSGWILSQEKKKKDQILKKKAATECNCDVWGLYFRTSCVTPGRQRICQPRARRSRPRQNRSFFFSFFRNRLLCKKKLEGFIFIENKSVDIIKRFCCSTIPGRVAAVWCRYLAIISVLFHYIYTTGST